MAEKRQKREISFTEKDNAINEYLKTKTNASKYIIDLIRKDINGTTEEMPLALEGKVDMILEELREIKDIISERTLSLNIVPNEGFETEVLRRLDDLLDDED